MKRQRLYWEKYLTSVDTSYEGGTALNNKDCWQHMALQVTEYGGTATSWTVTLQGSLDGSTWTDLTTHQKAVEGNGKVKHVVDKPCTFLRAYVTAITLGTATQIKINVLAV
jgi:hypothetical protein